MTIKGSFLTRFFQPGKKENKMEVKGYKIQPKAYLKEADLEGANLEGAYLRAAYLRGANLEGANLGEADLRWAYLRGANLRGTDFRGADLRKADFGGADLRGAYLRGANLRGAYLRGADFRGADLPHFQICPSEGSFIGWKKTTRGVIKILIPSEAKRTSCLVGRKCRAEYVVPLEGDGLGGTSPTHNSSVVYERNKKVCADSFDDDIRVDCTHGIHFFMTKKEAVEW